MIVDLHSHSYFSDGELSPASLIDRAREAGVELYSITDHDTLDAYLHLNGELFDDLHLIPGVEISCHLDKQELHIVALNIELEHPQLLALLVYNQSIRQDKADWAINKLTKLGYPDIRPHLAEVCKGSVTCRTHLAQALVKAGIVPDIERAFKRYLGRKGKLWQRPQWRQLDEVIETIHAAGGVAILAHPTKYRMSSGKLSWVIEEFCHLGGDAMEVNYSGISPNHKAYLRRMALKFDLAVSVGSDFHRPAQRYAPIGGFSQIDSTLKPVWEQISL